MKNLFLLFIPLLFFTFCATTNKTSNNALNDALLGENELVIIKSLGPPFNVIHTSSEEKVIVYEYYIEGPSLGHNNPNSSQSASNNRFNTTSGVTFTSNVNKVATDPNYSSYQTNVLYLKLHIDKQGNCFRIENTLPRKQTDDYLKQVMHYKAKN